MKKINFIIIYSFILSSFINGSQDPDIKTNDTYHNLGMMLISGVRSKDIDKIHRALTLGANINYQTKETGDTAFHIACVQASDLKQPLLQAGIDITIKNKNGRTGIDEVNAIMDELLSLN